jgi:hypothetical protein
MITARVPIVTVDRLCTTSNTGWPPTFQTTTAPQPSPAAPSTSTAPPQILRGDKLTWRQGY